MRDHVYGTLTATTMSEWVKGQLCAVEQSTVRRLDVACVYANQTLHAVEILNGKLFYETKDTKETNIRTNGIRIKWDDDVPFPFLKDPDTRKHFEEEKDGFTYSKDDVTVLDMAKKLCKSYINLWVEDRRKSNFHFFHEQPPLWYFIPFSESTPTDLGWEKVNTFSIEPITTETGTQLEDAYRIYAIQQKECTAGPAEYVNPPTLPEDPFEDSQVVYKSEKDEYKALRTASGNPVFLWNHRLPETFEIMKDGKTNPPISDIEAS